MDALTAQRISNVRRVYGDQVADRVQLLTQSPEGWNGKDAQPMDTLLLDTLLGLDLKDKISKHSGLGVFLDHMGNLVLSCSISSKAVDVCINRDYVEICADDFELTVSVEEARRVLHAM